MPLSYCRDEKVWEGEVVSAGMLKVDFTLLGWRLSWTYSRAWAMGDDQHENCDQAPHSQLSPVRLWLSKNFQLKVQSGNPP